jgi:hypothetical protein
MWDRDPSSPVAGGRDVVEGCEALLRGTSVAHVRRCGAEPRAADWYDLLAHGKLVQLIRAACGPVPSPGDPPASWEEAVALLSRAVLGIAATQPRLDVLQRRWLVPLELEMLDGPAPATPAGLVQRVRLEVLDVLRSPRGGRHER